MLSPQPRLLLSLPPGWADVSAKYAGGGATFIRSDAAALQISYALCSADQFVTERQLADMASDACKQSRCGDLLETRSGPCRFGKLGTAVYTGPKYKRAQIWFLSDGQNIIMASHLSVPDPDPAELAEAEHIVRNVTLSSD